MNSIQRHNGTIRPATRDDIQPICEIISAYSMALRGVGLDARKNIELSWGQPGFSLETDTRVIELPDERIIGYGLVEDVEAPHVRAGGWMRVHPEFKGQGAEDLLQDWIEERAREAVHKAPPEARVILTQGVLDEDADLRLLLESRAYSIRRYFWRMEIDLAASVPDPVWPEGITVRGFVLQDDLDALVRAHMSAFSDHWGHVAVPFEQELTQWNHWIRNDPEFDETLTFLALAGDDIVGYASCDLRHSEDPAMGYIGVLGVTRPWRRKGIALALLRHTFRDFKNRGQTRVCLGVDSASLTGAVDLYEAAGMTSTRQTAVYEKELRPGKDLSLQSLEGERSCS